MVIEQRTPEWYAARKGRVTASNVGAILGLDPYRNADDVLRAMVREYHGAEREFTGNAATEWGTANEALAKAAFELEYGVTVEHASFVVHPEHDWLGASPDGIINGKTLLEIKCPYGLRNEPLPSFKPISEQPHYYAQMQVQMACTGAEICIFIQWTPAALSVEWVGFDEKWWAENFPALKCFHMNYFAEIDNPDHLKPKRKEVETVDAKRLLQEYDDTLEIIDQATERKKELMARFVEMTGGQDGLICGRKLTKVVSQGSVSYAKVVKEHCPDVDLEPYRGKASESWRLT